MSSPSIGDRARRGVSWNVAAAVATNGCRILVLAVLGRTLSSSDFGVVAAAVSVNAILFGLRDFGIGQALVQRKEITKQHITTAFAVCTYFGFALSAALFVCSPLVARWFALDELTDIVRALAPLFLLGGVGTTARMLCAREMQFRAIAIIDASSFCSGSVLSILLAIGGAGPWALVVGYLAEELLATTSFVVYRRAPASLRIDTQRFRELFAFGGGQTISYLLGISATFADNFIVGRYLGSVALGNYTRAYDLVKFPSTLFAAVIGNVLFPALSRLQSEHARVSASLRRGVFANATILLPLSAYLIVVAPEVITILIGPGWGEVVLPFRILALTMLFRTTQKLGAIVSQAMGRVHQVAFAYLIYLLLVVVGARAAVPWGIAGIAVSTAISITAVCFLSLGIASRASRLDIRSIVRAHLPGLLVALSTAAASQAVAAVVRPWTNSPWIVASVTGCAALIGALSTTWFLARSGVRDLAWMSDQFQRIRSGR